MDLPGTKRDPVVYPPPDEFMKLARPHATVPVVREVLADRLTPVSAYERVCRGQGSFLLESVEGGERLARYSFIGTEPELTLRARDGRVWLQGEAGTSELKLGAGETPLDVLEAKLGQTEVVDLPGLPRFSGGAVGYMAYDIVRYFERLPSTTQNDLMLDDSAFLITRSVLAFDHVRHRILIICNATIETDPMMAYRQALARIETLVERLHGPYAPPPATAEAPVPPAQANMSQSAYEDIVRQCKEYIYAGDAFQIVPSLRISVPIRCSSFELYRALRSINPSPYMYFLDLGDCQIVGSSPEILATVEKSRVMVRPIAGTRPRGATDAEDERLEAELLADEKERAEHIMLVDLGRNDVGRVSAYGTVAVEELMTIERYSHVMHIVSSISGQLAPGKTAFDAVRACFPAGTLTGAPKVRAMEIIEELEPTRRGLYGGAVGYFGFHGSADFAIAIRTILVRDGVAHMQAGAGVVADSEPSREYAECMNKAKAMVAAVEMAHAGLE